MGIDLAVHLVERLLSPSGGVVLEVCRALWTLQALKEQESWESIVALDKSLVAEHERLESELDARLSIAGAVSNAVSQMNQRERHNFQINAGQQRQHVLNQSAWSFRQLLCWQQQALATLDVPGFEEGPTVDAAALQLQSQICQYLHSAFYIRNRMGSEPHETMLRSQLKKLQKEQEGCRSPKQASTTNSVPMVRQHSPLPPPSYNSHNIMTGGNLMMPIMQPQQQHLQQQQQTSYNPYPPQQQPPLQQQPMMMGMHTYAPQGMLYGQQQQPPMMMMQQQQLYLPPQLPLPPLPPSQPQPPPYGGQPQYPYYQQ